MRYAIEKVKPQTVIHLGDYYEDGADMSMEYPHIMFHQVPGNCDRYRSMEYHPEKLCYDVGGVRMFMTHGHLHNVKTDTWALEYEAQSKNAAIALYGHTHRADLRKEDHLWIMNPGACGSSGGSVGIIETDGREIVSCKILYRKDLEALL